MTLTPRKIYRPGWHFLPLVAVLAIPACVSLPPPAESIARAERALEGAREVRAGQFAAEEYQRAERQLQAARAAADRRDAVRAHELAELAEVNADLARARSRAAAWRAEVEEKSAENAQLRRSLETEERR